MNIKTYFFILLTGLNLTFKVKSENTSVVSTSLLMFTFEGLSKIVNEVTGTYLNLSNQEKLLFCEWIIKFNDDIVKKYKANKQLSDKINSNANLARTKLLSASEKAKHILYTKSDIDYAQYVFDALIDYCIESLYIYRNLESEERKLVISIYTETLKNQFNLLENNNELKKVLEKFQNSSGGYSFDFKNMLFSVNYTAPKN